MSKKVAFPVMSATITGILYILALLLGSLAIFTSAVLTGSTLVLVNGILFFIGAFLAGWALLSFALHPALDQNQRIIATVFLVLLLFVLFNAGVSMSLSW